MHSFDSPLDVPTTITRRHHAHGLDPTNSTHRLVRISGVPPDCLRVPQVTFKSQPIFLDTFSERQSFACTPLRQPYIHVEARASLQSAHTSNRGNQGDSTRCRYIAFMASRCCAVARHHQPCSPPFQIRRQYCEEAHPRLGDFKFRVWSCSR